MPKTKPIVNIALLLAVAIVCLLALEGFSRAFFYLEPRNFPPILRDDAELCYSTSPNISTLFKTREFETGIKTNSLGFRESKEGFQTPSIMVLGDSFVFGIGVQANETVGNRMQGLLNSKNFSYNVYNFGVGGYSTHNELALAKRYIQEMRPRLILLGFYPNDPRENLENCSFDVDKEGYLITKGQNPSPIKKWLQLHCNLYRLVKRIASGGRELPLDYVQYEEEYDNKTARAWNITSEQLEELRFTARANGAKLVVFLIPDKIKLSGVNSPDRVERNLANLTGRYGIYFIDLTEDLIRKGGAANYYEVDPHWLPSGHAIAAEGIVDYLIEEGLVTNAKE
jgi:hypothetical protein